MVCSGMSAYGGKTDIREQSRRRQLLTQSGHYAAGNLEGSVDEIASLCYPARTASKRAGGSLVRSMFGFLCCAFLFSAVHDPAWAQSPSGRWISEGGRAEIEIYSCGSAGQNVSNQKLLDTLCGYATDKGPGLCGRVARVLPPGLAELQAKGKKAEDVLGHPVLCVMSGADKAWPWKGGVFNLDDSTPYYVRLSLQGADKLKGSACGLGGWYCPSKGEFVWTKSAN